MMWPILAQVEVTVPVTFTGPDAERGIDGLGAPGSQHAAITVEASVAGISTWAEASINGTVVTLTPTAPLSEPGNGTLLRFLAPADLAGPSSLACTGSAALPLRRPDGLPPARGQIIQGALVEVVLAGEAWILTNLAGSDCPPGTIAISDRVCIERADQGNTLWFPAADRCTNLGGRLCSWDEFYIACTQYGDQLTGLFNAWEWIDDSSNHANSAVQVGFQNCTAQRWANPNNVTLGNSRCCFKSR
ncbi:MAG: hypothetical protein ACO1NQ_09685 [Flavobacteriales bacterium]